MNEKKTCYLCGSTEFEKLEGSVRDDASLDVLCCKNCSLVSLSSFDHIDENFYENDMMHGGEVNVKNWLEQTKDDDSRRFRFLKKELKNKKVLDFGCGNGGFLKRSKKLAKKVAGIDLQTSMADFYKKNNLEVFQDIGQIEDKFDLITMFHVLEHIKDPIELLKRLGESLTPEGQIIIEVPSSDDALLSIYKNPAFSHFTYWSCHLFLFNEKTLLEVIEKAGFRVNYLKYVQRYGFANHLYWQIAKKPGGHKKLWFMNCKVMNWFYEKALASVKATDTLVVSISK